MEEMEFNIRLDTVERNIEKNIELTSENIKLTSQALEEMRKVTDKFGIHVEYLTRDNERLREESDKIHQDMAVLDARIRDIGLEVLRLTVQGVPREMEEPFEKKADSWAFNQVGKWVLGIAAATVGGIVSLFIRSLWRGQ